MLRMSCCILACTAYSSCDILNRMGQEVLEGDGSLPGTIREASLKSVALCWSSK